MAKDPESQLPDDHITGIINPAYVPSHPTTPPRHTPSPSSSSSSSEDRQPSFNNLPTLRHSDFAPATAYPSFKQHGAQRENGRECPGFHSYKGMIMEEEDPENPKGRGKGLVMEREEEGEEGEWRGRRRVVFYVVVVVVALLLCTGVVLMVTLMNDDSKAEIGAQDSLTQGPDLAPSDVTTVGVTSNPSDVMPPTGVAEYESSHHPGEVLSTVADVATTTPDAGTTTFDDETTAVDGVTTTVDDVTTFIDDATTAVDDVTTTIDDVTTTIETTANDDGTTAIDDVTTTVETTAIDDVTTAVEDVTTTVGPDGEMTTGGDGKLTTEQDAYTIDILDDC